MSAYLLIWGPGSLDIMLLDEAEKQIEACEAIGQPYLLYQLELVRTSECVI